MNVRIKYFIRQVITRCLLVITILGCGWYMLYMPGYSFRGPLPPLTPEETKIESRLKGHIQQLAGNIGERNIWNNQNLQASANYIETAFKKLGYPVSEQSFIVENISVKNIIAERRGTSHPNEIIIIGAHYDTVFDSPGADDNASGVAAIIEMARLLAATETKRTLRFVAFVNEEPPFFYTNNMGSNRYAQMVKNKNEKIVAMLSIESIGYYSDQKYSQKYPFPFSFFYPDTANFIGFVGNLSSGTLVRDAIGTFRQHTQFPSEGISAPSWIRGVHWSDQWSFWRQGYPAIMITGTALYRNPYYHTAGDTPGVVDYSRTARVVNGLSRVVNDLAAEGQ